MSEREILRRHEGPGPEKRRFVKGAWHICVNCDTDIRQDEIVECEACYKELGCIICTDYSGQVFCKGCEEKSEES